MAGERKEAVIVGLGLIGGSIGTALVRQGWRVAFIDPSVELSAALARGAAHRALQSIDEAYEHALIVLATPVDVAIDFLVHTDPGERVVTSVCSVMQPLKEAASNRPIRFIAGHPFAGSEKAGLEFAREDLFVERHWFIDRDADHSLVEELIEMNGATAVPIDSSEHDEIVALTSHLPQILSTALASVVALEGERAADFVGSGLQSFLRLAGSESSVWTPVIAANHDSIVSARRSLDRALDRILDGEGSEDFRRAVEVYGKLHEPRNGSEGES